MRRRLTLDLIGGIVATAAMLALCLRANLKFDDSWDGTAYHLVFAAFRAGILTPDDLTLIRHLQDFYAGFPPLLDFVRGYTWRFTGSILILQNFNLLAAFALSAFWRLNFKLPVRWSLIAILSVPLLQIAATTLYVDMFANCMFAIPLSALTGAYLERRALSRTEVAISLVALAVAANTKLQFTALAFLLLCAFCLYQFVSLAREKKGARPGCFSDLRRRRRLP
jgi:hypothetical protein